MPTTQLRLQITFSGRIPSKKNSKQIVRGRLISSQAYLKWEREQLSALLGITPLQGCFNVIADFWLPDARKTDLSNKWESLADCLVEAGILEDDNCVILPNIQLIYRGIDRVNPRAVLEFERIS